MATAVLFFNQGWTDIFNCLGLTSMYCTQYDTLHVILRDDAKPLFDFYIKNTNIKPHYVKLNNENIDQFLQNNPEMTILCNGCHDKYRTDKYKDVFSSCSFIENFCKAFYTFYDIPYSTRVDFFNIERDYELENIKYKEFIQEHSEKYILSHEISQDDILQNTDGLSDIACVNLSNSTDTFFDYIKILENSREMHLLDSVWAAFAYLLDTKYQLFKNKKIFVYCKRDNYKMFDEPIKLDNWILI